MQKEERYVGIKTNSLVAETEDVGDDGGALMMVVRVVVVVRAMMGELLHFGLATLLKFSDN